MHRVLINRYYEYDYFEFFDKETRTLLTDKIDLIDAWEVAINAKDVNNLHKYFLDKLVECPFNELDGFSLAIILEALIELDDKQEGVGEAIVNVLNSILEALPNHSDLKGMAALFAVLFNMPEKPLWKSHLDLARHIILTPFQNIYCCRWRGPEINLADEIYLVKVLTNIFKNCVQPKGDSTISNWTGYNANSTKIPTAIESLLWDITHRARNKNQDGQVTGPDAAAMLEILLVTMPEDSKLNKIVKGYIPLLLVDMINSDKGKWSKQTLQSILNMLPEVELREPQRNPEHQRRWIKKLSAEIRSQLNRPGN